MKEKNDVRDRVMKIIFQKNEKDLKNVEKRSRFASDKEKAKTVKKIKKIKEVEKIASLSTRKKTSNKFRIIDI
jgi:ABC-type oligopeptide transport system ATPase subunit